MVEEGGKTGAQRAGPGPAGHREPHDAAAAAQHGPADRVPFGVVGVEQGGSGVAVQHRGQFPAEVGRVLQPGVHALSAGRTVHVRGVPGEEDPADPVPRRLPFVAVEAGHPAGLAHVVVAAEGEPGDLLHLVQAERRGVRDVAVPVPADHAVVAVAEGGQEGEGLAVRADGEELLRFLAEPYVGQDDRADDRPAREGQPHRPTHGAAHPVRPDGVLGAQRLALLPAGPAHREGDALAVLRESGHLGVVPQGDPGLLGTPQQQLLDLVLRDDEQVVEAGGEFAEADGEAAEEADVGEPPSGRLDVLGDPAGVELLQCAGVQDEGAGEVADLSRALLDEGDGDSGEGEVTGEQEPGRPGADDEHAGAGVVRDWSVMTASPRSTSVGQRVWANACSPT